MPESPRKFKEGSVSSKNPSRIIIMLRNSSTFPRKPRAGRKVSSLANLIRSNAGAAFPAGEMTMHHRCDSKAMGTARGATKE